MGCGVVGIVWLIGKRIFWLICNMYAGVWASILSCIG